LFIFFGQKEFDTFLQRKEEFKVSLDLEHYAYSVTNEKFYVMLEIYMLTLFILINLQIILHFSLF